MQEFDAIIRQLFFHNCNPFAAERISQLLVLIPYLWAKKRSFYGESPYVSPRVS
jgi:hypothetical protein